MDPGLIELFATSARSHAGRALETVVVLELERRGWEVSYAARCRTVSPGCRPRAGSWSVDPVPAPAVLWREAHCRCRSI